MVPLRLEHVPAPPTRSEILKPIGCLNILVLSKMATERVLGGVALRRAKSAVGAEVVEQVHELGELPAALHVRSGRCWDVYEARDHWRGVDLAHAPSDLSAWWRCCCKVLEISYMQSYRDLDVSSVCQVSPRGVALMYPENSANGWIQRWKIGY